VCIGVVKGETSYSPVIYVNLSGLGLLFEEEKEWKHENINR
jgi:hypothetical protein